MRAKRTHKQNLKRSQLQDIRKESNKLVSNKSVSALICEGTSKGDGTSYIPAMFHCYDGYDEESYTGPRSIVDKSLEGKTGIKLLRRGKPFSDIPVLIRETGRTHKRFIEDENGILSRGRHSWKRKSGPVTQVVKDGKEVKK